MRSRMAKLTLLCVLCASAVWAQEEKVNLNVVNVPVVEAFQKLFEGTNKSYLITPSIPADQKITAVLQNVSFQTALNALCESAGLSWRQVDGIYVIEKKRDDSKPFFTLGGIQFRSWPEVLSSKPAVTIMESFFTTKATFTCPHCKKSVTKTVERVKCLKCKRELQPEWKFCPYDGMQRQPQPVDVADWTHCPFCGKAIK